jgi:hypothetical protein
MDRRRLESTDECHVQSVAVVVGRKTNDFVIGIGNVQLGQLDIIAAMVTFGVQLIRRNYKLLVTKEGGDDNICQTQQSAQNEEQDLERWV